MKKFVITALLFTGLVSAVFAQEVTNCEECAGEAAFMFESETGQVKAGLPQSKVAAWLGKPAFKFSKQGAVRILGVDTDYAFGFHHPDYATAAWVVGFKQNKVVAHKGCSLGATRMECNSTKQFWKQLNGN